jgi:hypothetical protein
MNFKTKTNKLPHRGLGGFLILLTLLNCKGDSVGVSSSSSGIGGSTARFTIVDDYLYIVDNASLKTYEIKNSNNPNFIRKVNLQTTVETIFPFKNHLLIGTQTGMYIYSLSYPDNPKYKSVYNHIVSCDPVVADGNYAYVTLRSGTNCRRGMNLLDVIDIANMSSPKLIKSYSMQNPHGLGVDGKWLFVCEGDYGLKMMDKSNPLDIKELKFFQDVKSLDVIPNENTLIVTGKDGIYQYGYNAQNEVKLLSKIATQP